jgi:hypothetical protein
MSPCLTVLCPLSALAALEAGWGRLNTDGIERLERLLDTGFDTKSIPFKQVETMVRPRLSAACAAHCLANTLYAVLCIAWLCFALPPAAARLPRAAPRVFSPVLRLALLAVAYAWRYCALILFALHPVPFV